MIVALDPNKFDDAWKPTRLMELMVKTPEIQTKVINVVINKINL